jgi:hypothetical protein
MAIIGGTVFRVRKINIVFTSTSTLNRDNVSKQLARELDYLKGKSILFGMDKQKIKDTVEKSEILAKVINIKAEFPNTITIDIRERYPVFIYRETPTQKFVMDAEMRVLYKNDYPDNEDDLTDITSVGSGLFKTNIAKGEYITGDGINNQAKIDLIKIIPDFFASNGNYEASVIHQIRDISFGQDETGVITMNINVKPENHNATDVQLKVIKTPSDDFAELFACVWATMERSLEYETEDENGVKGEKGIKQASQAGIYTVYYTSNSKLEVLFADPINGIYKAKFVESGERKY